MNNQSNYTQNFKRSTIVWTFLILTWNAAIGQCEMNNDHPGYRMMTQNINENLITREYILHVPNNYDENENYPLVIVFHGFGDCAAYWAEAMENNYGFNDIANAEEFFVAYPQAAYRPEKEDVYWEPGNDTGEDIYENDVYFTQEMINHIAQDYSINQSKVYAAGYSNGGMLAYSIGCSRGDMVAGIGVMSGAMLDDADSCIDSFPIPIIIFHGVGDYVLPYSGNEWYGPVSETVSLWINHNQIPVTSLTSIELNGGDVSVDQYAGGQQGTCLSFYTINQEYGAPGDHVWFTQNIDGISPSQILWDFFNDGCNGEFTSVIDYKETMLPEIYPNPFEDELHTSALGSELMFVNLINMHGQTVLSGQLNELNDTGAFKELSTGLYILQYGNESKLIIKD